MTKSGRATPWRISYADGAANVYRFAQAAAAQAVEFEYVPVTPEQSSTGTYSGGEPRKARLADDDARLDELWRRVERIEADIGLRADARNKGTGAFEISTPAGTREFIIEQGPALGELNRFLAQFRE